MKTIVVLFCCTLVACSQRSDLAAMRHGLDELEFRFEPSFEEATMVWLGRTPQGEILCAVYSVPELETLRRNRSLNYTKITEAKVSGETFHRLAAALDDPDFIAAAETTPPAGMDGVSYFFRRQTGSRNLEYRFWMPEARPKEKSSMLALRLRDQFVAAAGMSWPFPKRPNKAPEPTPGSVTPRATEGLSK